MGNQTSSKRYKPADTTLGARGEFNRPASSLLPATTMTHEVPRSAFHPRVQLLPDSGLGIIVPEGTDLGVPGTAGTTPLLPQTLNCKDLEGVHESGDVLLEEAAVFAPDGKARAAVRATWNLDFDISVLREGARGTLCSEADMLVASPVFCVPAIPQERASLDNEPQLMAGVAGLALTDAQAQETIPPISKEAAQGAPWRLLPLLKGVPAQAAPTHWRLVFSRSAPQGGKVSLSLQRLSSSTTQSTPLPAWAPPAGADKGVEVEAVSLQWDFLVQGLSTSCPDPITHLQGSAPAHIYSSHPESCGLQLSLEHQLDLGALSDHHTLRVVALLQPPLADQLKDAPGAVVGQQTPTHKGLEPAAAGYPTSPYPFAPGDRTAMNSPYAAPAAAQEEPQIILISLSPRIVMLENFLDEETCEVLKTLAQPRLAKSKVSSGTETPSRTSQGTFFTGDAAKLPLVESVEKRIDWLINHPALVKGKLKLERTEALQVIAYNPGEFYTEHYDNKAGGIVTRAATIVCYLSNCPAGGATYFPKSTGIPTTATVPEAATSSQLAEMSGHLHSTPAIKRPGLRVNPARGRAIVFWSSLPSGAEDLASLHAAEPVLSGDKWIVTRWFRERHF